MHICSCECLRAWFEELRKRRVAELKQELAKSENSIGLAQMYTCIYVSIEYNYVLFVNTVWLNCPHNLPSIYFIAALA